MSEEGEANVDEASSAKAPSEPPTDPPESSVEATGGHAPRRPWLVPLVIWLICAAVYSLTLGDRLFQTSPDNHYAHLANSWLEGRLDHGGDPPGRNDWACFDAQEQDLCPNNRFRFSDQERYKWYVSFPPFPAVVMLPAVAALGVESVPDRFIWALIGALGPMCLFLLLRRLRPLTGRSLREELALSALFAFGSVFFFVAVQGTVWFAAHCVAVPLLALYAYFAVGARAPIRAGLMLGLAFLTRPTTALLCLFFAIEAMRRHQQANENAEGGSAGGGATPETGRAWYVTALRFARNVSWGPAILSGARFAAPILVCGGVAMWMNDARFADPFEFGHTYLQIGWRTRIERWGLFNYHFVSKNLAVFFGGLPWLSVHDPHVMISRHGLAFWVTTPFLLMAPFAKRVTPTLVACWAAILPVMALNLMYQNSGWIQFGYRFSLDYLVLVFAVLALTKRPFRIGFALLLLWSIAINTFGAITFDRAGRYYDNDGSQERLFQPDGRT
ncbi:MAG: hypothetical protein AAF411_14265 [Myxococcota bacterium]